MNAPSSSLELVYDCDRSALGAALAARFAPLNADAALHDWLTHWSARPHGYFLSKLSQLLSGYASSYDVHGWLGAYQMHLLSAQAWGELLGQQHRASLLDVGAGAGYVTEGARGWFDSIVCTETSAPLRKRLARRGFEALASDLSARSLERSFDVVSCFNVLDRTSRPVSLLKALASHVQPGGRLLVCLPLPAAPHVHVAGGTVSARERLPCSAQSWEGAARELTEQLFTPTLEPAQLTLERLARVPYLSRGDSASALYAMDAGLWLFRRATSQP